jgi:tetratricopeptide (TPR) repeat protein
MRAAVASPTYAVETMVRAGHFLLRSNFVEAAGLAARDALARAGGYIPAYVLAIKCAVREGDRNLALSATMQGIESVDNDTARVPFFKAMVEIKSADKTRDADLIKALGFLMEHDKSDSQWAERLGQAYFENREMKRAMTILIPVLADDLKSVKVQSLLLAAEAARCEGNATRSLEILETAYAMYPQKMTILNNLVYNLAMNPGTVNRAKSLLPALLAMGGESFVVYDTASVVFMQSGQLDQARVYMEKAQKLIDNQNYAAPEANLNAARILARAGDWDAARAKAEEARRNPHAPASVEVSARRLLDEIRRSLER